MTHSSLIKIVFFALTTLATSCVSVRFPSHEIQRSSSARWKAPQAEFVEKEAPHAERTWQNSLNRNTISYLSECGKNISKNLLEIENGILADIRDHIKIQTHAIEICSVEGRHTIVDAKMDGVSSRIELVIFEKENCVYVLSYIAAKKSYGDNQKDFNQFVKGFSVP